MGMFNYLDTPIGELEYLYPNFDDMMRAKKWGSKDPLDVTGNIANRFDVPTGTIETVYGADGVLGRSNLDPRFGATYKDNNDLVASILYDQSGREANINAGLLDGNAYANYIKDPANNSTLKVGYEEPGYGFSAAKDSNMGNEYAANFRPIDNTSLSFLKNDATKKLMAKYYPDSQSSISAAATNTNNGTGYTLGYGNQLTDDSNISAEAYKNPEDTGLFIKYLLNF